MRRRTLLGALAGLPLAGTAATAASPARWPARFLWGTATAGHQVDGGNVNSDYWVLEHARPTRFKESSGDACDSWNRWHADIALLKQLGCNAYRFSLEWARIEPAPGEWSQAALDHYRSFCAALREAGIMPIATYHHFTSPAWIAGQGGWESADTADRFARYAERTTKAIGDLIGAACTLNEPNAQVNSWVLRGFKPDPTDGPILAAAAKAIGSDRFHAYFMGDSLRVRDVCIAAHTKGGAAIRAAAPGLKVGITLALQDLLPGPGGERLYRDLFANGRKPFYDAARDDDFIGIQTYMRFRTGPDGYLPPRAGQPINMENMEVPPDALGAVAREAWRETGVPVFVTENGIQTTDEALRERHVAGAIASLRTAMADGVPVLGYMHWSLMDNFEWEQGYGPKFGLYAVDRQSFARTPKPAAALYRRLIRAAGVRPVAGRL